VLTAASASTPSWSSRTVVRVARAYGVSPATLVSRRRDPLLVEARRVAMGLLAERGLGPCWITTLLARDHSTVLRASREGHPDEVYNGYGHGGDRAMCYVRTAPQ